MYVHIFAASVIIINDEWKQPFHDVRLTLWVILNVINIVYLDFVYIKRTTSYHMYIKTFWKIDMANAIFWMYLGGTTKIFFFFRNKTFLFFKKENWNFQHLSEKNPWITRFQLRQLKITIVWISWMSSNFVRFHQILFHTNSKSFSFISWKTEKSFVPKKNIF